MENLNDKMEAKNIEQELASANSVLLWNHNWQNEKRFPNENRLGFGFSKDKAFCEISKGKGAFYVLDLFTGIVEITNENREVICRKKESPLVVKMYLEEALNLIKNKDDEEKVKIDFGKEHIEKYLPKIKEKIESIEKENNDFVEIDLGDAFFNIYSNGNIEYADKKDITKYFDLQNGKEKIINENDTKTIQCFSVTDGITLTDQKQKELLEKCVKVVKEKLESIENIVSHDSLVRQGDEIISHLTIEKIALLKSALKSREIEIEPKTKEITTKNEIKDKVAEKNEELVTRQKQKAIIPQLPLQKKISKTQSNSEIFIRNPSREVKTGKAGTKIKLSSEYSINTTKKQAQPKSVTLKQKDFVTKNNNGAETTRAITSARTYRYDANGEPIKGSATYRPSETSPLFEKHTKGGLTINALKNVYSDKRTYEEFHAQELQKFKDKQEKKANLRPSTTR